MILLWFVWHRVPRRIELVPRPNVLIARITVLPCAEKGPLKVVLRKYSILGEDSGPQVVLLGARRRVAVSGRVAARALWVGNRHHVAGFGG